MKRSFIDNNNGESSDYELPVKRSKSVPFSFWKISDEMLGEIIEYVPINHWPQLKFVSRQFYLGTKLAYRWLVNLNIYDMFPRQYRKCWNDPKSENFKSPLRLERILNTVRTDCKNLHKLRGLDCVYGSISMPNFVRLQKISKLTSISLTGCNFGIEDFSDFLKNCPRLQELEVDNRCFRGSLNRLKNPDRFLCHAFGPIKRLKSITLTSFTDFSGIFLSKINVEHLESLNLRDSYFQTTYLSDFVEHCSKLKSLVLSDFGRNILNVGIDKSVLQHLPGLMNLEKLIFDVSSVIINKQKKFSFSTNDFVETIGKCRHLKKLSILDDDSYLITNRLIETIFTKCRSLQILDLNFEKIKFNTVKKVGYCLQGLKTLSVSRCSQKYVQKFVSQLPWLTNLIVLHMDVSECEWHYFKGLTNMKNLRELCFFDSNLSGSITDDLLAYWGKKKFFRQFTSFWLNGNGFSEFGLRHVVENGQNFKRLTLVSLEDEEISNNTLYLIANNCQMLEYVSIFAEHYEDITKDGLIFLLKSCKGLKEMKINNDLLESLVSSCEFFPFASIVKLGHSENPDGSNNLAIEM